MLPGDSLDILELGTDKINTICNVDQYSLPSGGNYNYLAVQKKDSEKALVARLPEVAAKVGEMRHQKNYIVALTEISSLRHPIDLFFDKVMVMVDDERIRANRLALLQTLLQEFSTIADFSEIVTENKSS